MIRVLIAEDSLTVQELLTRVLEADPEIEIVGRAKNGVEAVSMAKERSPDVIAMDIQMPRMDGFEATKRIMIESPTPIVIVSGRVDVREVSVSMQALRAGALAVLPKPGWPESDGFARESQRLVETLKTMSRVSVVSHWPSPPGADRTPPPELPPPPNGAVAEVVAVASSTGGPAALHYLLSTLPGDFPAPILVVQHMAAGFIEGLTRWLGTVSSLKIKLAQDGETLHPWTVYVAPEDRHLLVDERRTVRLSEEAPVGGFRPSANLLFESVGAACGTAGLAVVLTGMGADGLDGLRSAKRNGTRVITQDEESSVVFGMPKAVVSAGLSDLTLPLREIPGRLMEEVSE